MTPGARTGIWRNLPLVVVVVLAGPLLTILNPGLFWDDWLWIYQDPTESIQIGRELGIWWGGYLTNAINALPQPVLTLRLVSLASWAIAACAAASSLYRLRVLGRWEAWVLFSLLAAAPIPMIRFLNSVAMYNVYIASFWIGFAILVSDMSPSWRRWISLPFFILSFYLSSLLLLYGAVLLLLLLEAMQRLGGVRSLLPAWPLRSRLASTGSEDSSSPLFLLQGAIVYFARRNWFFILLPLVFFLATTLLRARSPFYSGYNQVRPTGAIIGAVKALVDFPVLAIKYVVVPIRTVSLIAAGCLAFALTLLVRRLPDRTTIPTWHSIATLGLIGSVMLYVGVLPYFMVGKRPLLGDFYEARHILTAVPGIVLIEIALLQGFVRIGASWWSRVALFLRDVGVAILLSLSILFSAVSGLGLLKDWFTNEAITAYLKQNSSIVEKFGTVIFDDQTDSTRFSDRFIWNYEYTGALIRVFGSKRLLGISLAEYRDWPKDVLLITDEAYRKRYNLALYDFYKPHLVVRLRNSGVQLETGRLLATVFDFWIGRTPDISRFLEFAIAEEYIEADRQMTLMERILQALNRYKLDHGVYPSSLRPTLSAMSSESGIPLLVLGAQTPQIDACKGKEPNPELHCGPASSPANQASVLSQTPSDAAGPENGLGVLPSEPAGAVGVPIWFDAISPAYLPRDTLDPTCLPTACGLLYISDGKDLKLVYQKPKDMPFARQAYGMNIDPVRFAYGFWTPEAARW